MPSACAEERSELDAIARRLRRHIVTSTTEAGSGHPSTSLSMVEAITVLYFGGVLRIDPSNPQDPDRDRFILSKGHGAPGLYAVLAEAGFFPVDELATLRKLGSRLEGHPNMCRVPGVEASTGSLGQGLSIGVGHALAAGIDGRDYRVYVMTGDGETEQGQIWEAIMYAGNHGVDNLTLILDHNGYQQTGAVADIQPLDPLTDKLSAFGWEAREIDGHSLDEVAEAFAWARSVKGSPQAIVARTVKGKGVSLLEAEPGKWHGKPLSRAGGASPSRDRRLMFGITRVEFEKGQSTRAAFGDALGELGKDERIAVVDGDVNNSTFTNKFAERYPERFFNVGIAESNMVGIAAGLASSGKIAVASSFSTFLMSNAFDQIRMSIAFPNVNVKLVGSHAGISIGEDGPSQMAIEDVALACALPGFTVIVPADGPSAAMATQRMIERDGPTFLRCGRPDVPVIYPDGADFHVGRANTLREGDDVTLIANGIMVAMALDAAAALAEDGVEARVLDMHTVKPIDTEAIERAANETEAVVVAEEHLAYGGLGSTVAMVLTDHRPVPVTFVNLGDTYATSGTPEELLTQYGLTPGAITDAARRALKA